MTPGEALEVLHSRGILGRDAETCLNAALTKGGLSVDELSGPFSPPLTHDEMLFRFGRDGMRAVVCLCADRFERELAGAR